MRPNIDELACEACGTCVEACPEGVLDVCGSTARVVQGDACTGCETCVDACLEGAICVDPDPLAGQA